VHDRPLLVGSLIVVLAAGGFGLLGPLARFAYDAGLAPLSFVGWRATFGLAVLLIVIVARRARGIRLVNPLSLSSGDRIGLAAAVLAGLSLNVAVFYAFGLASVGIVLLAFYTYPALVAIVAAALGHERLDRARLVALGLALFGMALVVLGGLGGGGSVSIHPLGILLGFLAGTFQTIFVTVSRRRFRSVPPEQAVAWVMGVTAVACLFLAGAAGEAPGVIATHADALGLVVAAGVVAAGIPSVMFLVGIRTIGGTRSGILMLFEPLVGVTLAAILLHETMTAPQLSGGAAILGAAILVQRGSPGGDWIEPPAVPADHETEVRATPVPSRGRL
jgi:drug/metabolite transporter (DMT)-like permease